MIKCTIEKEAKTAAAKSKVVTKGGLRIAAHTMCRNNLISREKGMLNRVAESLTLSTTI